MDWNRTEAIKFLTDLQKHVATLSAATVVVVATVVEKVFPKPDYKWMVFVAMTLLLVALASALVSHVATVLIYEPVENKDKDSESIRTMAAFTMMVAVTAFLLGIALIALFFMVNWS